MSFTPEEFYNLAFKSKEPAVINEDVKKYINKIVILDEDKLLLRPIEWAVAYNHLELLKYLLKNGAKVPRNTYAVIRTIQYNYLDMIKYLMENGMLFNMDMIHWALCYNRTNVIKYLLSTYIYSEEAIRYYNAEYYRAYVNPDIIELLDNYHQFSNTKACK